MKTHLANCIECGRTFRAKPNQSVCSANCRKARAAWQQHEWRRKQKALTLKLARQEVHLRIEQALERADARLACERTQHELAAVAQ